MRCQMSEKVNKDDAIEILEGTEFYEIIINGWLYLQTESPRELERFCLDNEIDEVFGMPSWRIH